MADYVLTAKIVGVADSFIKAFQSANKTLQDLSDKTKAIGDKVSQMGQKLSIAGAGITAGITAPFIGAIKTTADFDSAMRKAGAIAGANATQLDAMTQAALDLGASTSLSGTQVADAMANMAAKGFDANQTISAMPGVISAAEASGEDLALVADIMSSSLNAFNLEASQSGKVADILAMAANKSAAGVGDLGYAFKYAAPSASSLGISMEELAAATGLMVGQGLAGEQAGTSLRMAMARLVKPPKEAAEAMAELGFSAVDSKNNFKPLNQIVGELGGSMKGMSEAQKLATLSTIFGTEAASGMLILLNQGQEGLIGLTKELENSEGASAAAAEQMKAGIGGSLENLSGAIESATISVMSQLNPMIQQISTYVTSLVERFNGLDDGTKKMIAMAAGIAAVAGPVLTVLGLMAMGIGGLVSAVGFLISPIGLVIGALLALGGAFGHQMATSESFRNNVLTVFESIKGKITSVVETIKGIVQVVVPIFTTLFSSIISGFQSAGGVGSGFGLQLLSNFIGLNPVIKGVILLFQNFGPQIVNAFQQIASMIIPVIGTLGTAIGQLASSVIPILMSAFASIIPIVMQVGSILISTIITILPIIINLFNNLVPIIMMVVQQVAGILAVIIPLIANLATALIPAISMIIQTVMNIVVAVAPAFIAIIQAIGAAIQVLLPIISSIIQTVIHVMTNIIQIITPIIGFIGMVISTIVAIIAPIIAFIAGVMTSIFASIRPIVTFVTGVFDTVTQVISSIWQGIMVFTGRIFTSIGTIISGLSSVVSGVFNTISGIISRIMNSVSKTISGVFDKIRSAWTGLTGFVNGVFGGISGSVSKLVGQVKGFVNKVVGGINSAVSIINKIPGVSIGKIPYLAHGTNDWHGGFAVMNEGGRGELVNLPNGAQVIPHDVSMKYAREAGKMSAMQSSDTRRFSDRGDQNITKIVEVPIYLEGKEIARATAKYTDWELSNRRTTKMRARGLAT